MEAEITYPYKKEFLGTNSENIWGLTSWRARFFRLSSLNRNQISFQTFQAARILRLICRHLTWIQIFSARIQKIRTSPSPCKSSILSKCCKVRGFWIIIASLWEGISLPFSGKKKKNWRIIFGNRHLKKKSSKFNFRENLMKIYL